MFNNVCEHALSFCPHPHYGEGQKTGQTPFKPAQISGPYTYSQMTDGMLIKYPIMHTNMAARRNQPLTYCDAKLRTKLATLSIKQYAKLAKSEMALCRLG